MKLIGGAIALAVLAQGVSCGTLSAHAQEATSRKIKRQQQILLQQRKQLQQNQQALDAQQRQLAQKRNENALQPAINHGIFGDCPVGFTYSLIPGGCYPDRGTIILYDEGSLRRGSSPN